MVPVLMGTYETVEGVMHDVLEVELDPDETLLKVYKEVQRYGEGRGVYESTLTFSGTLVLPDRKARELEVDEAGIAQLLCKVYQFKNEAEENRYLTLLQ